jgi:putative sigma-54 modulation protein
MDLKTRTQGLSLDQSLRAYLDERVEHAVGRFQHIVRSIDVRLTDENGPRGGDGMRCRVVVDVRGEGALVIEETRSEAFLAVARAMDRLRTMMRKHANHRAHRFRGRE